MTKAAGNRPLAIVKVNLASEIFVARLAEQVLHAALNEFLLLNRPLVERFPQSLDFLFQPLELHFAPLLPHVELLGGDLQQFLANFTLLLFA